MEEHTPQSIERRVREELARISDVKVRHALQAILVPPTSHLRNWDYSLSDEQFPCWTVALHEPSGTAIVYSEYGFGPRMPWGLVWTKDNWFGMDSGWFEYLEDAFRDSYAMLDEN